MPARPSLSAAHGSVCTFSLRAHRTLCLRDSICRQRHLDSVLVPTLLAWLFALVATGFWLLWPVLRSSVFPRHGETLVVVFDGYHRLDAALVGTGQRPLLLLTCPKFHQPSSRQRQVLQQQDRQFWSVQQGRDSAHQLTVLATWLQQPPRSLPAIGSVLLVSDAHHLPRLLPAARVALGGRGFRVSGWIADQHRPPEQRPGLPSPWLISRDWLRLQLWRLSGSTGSALRPRLRAHKQLVCG